MRFSLPLVGDGLWFLQVLFGRESGKIGDCSSLWLMIHWKGIYGGSCLISEER
jgi:hypothetical protein